MVFKLGAIKMFVFEISKNLFKIIVNPQTRTTFKSLFLLKLNDIWRLNVLKFYYRHCQKKLSAYFQRLIFKTIAEIHYHDTRQKTDK